MNTPAALLPPDDLRLLERTLEEMATHAIVDHIVWNRHANAVLAAVAELSTLRTAATTHAEALAEKDREIMELRSISGESMKAVLSASLKIDEMQRTADRHKARMDAICKCYVELNGYDEDVYPARAALTAHRAETQGEKNDE